MTEEEFEHRLNVLEQEIDDAIKLFDKIIAKIDPNTEVINKLDFDVRQLKF